MDTQLNQSPQETGLSIQGCGYRIDNDRVIISIERIDSNRINGHLSGTLRLQLCAFSQDINHEEAVLATTTIGEMTGQHFLQDCRYDLVFQQPPVGIWQIALQLSEWDGSYYALRDTVNFAVPYQAPYMDTSGQENNEQAKDIYLEPSAPEQATPKPPLENNLIPDQKAAEVKDKKTKKKASGYADGYLAINKSKVEKLLKVKGVPKKVLEKVIAERPYSSDKSVLNIKGMGPTMLKRIMESLLS